MMKACTFIGHRDFQTNKYDEIYNEIEKLIIEKKVNVFYVGTNGNFDRLVYKALVEIEKHYDIKYWLVLAYLNIKKENIYYDMNKTIFPQELEKTPLRFAISVRNKYMIKKSQYMICGINNTFTNSYNFVKLALNKNLTVINVGNFQIK